jgi:hypothetical protein
MSAPTAAPPIGRPRADPDQVARPYADAAPAIFASGLGSALPLPPRQKYPPPAGWTGADAPMASWPDIQAWIEDRPDANPAIRLADGVVGIDVDAYAHKRGASTLAAAIAAKGPPPPTFTVTSRDDGVSGIRLYRVPPGTVLVGALGTAGYGPDVEVIQRHHRYVVGPLAIHPEGRVYGCLGPDGALLYPGELPSADDLAELPAAWVDDLGVTREAVAGEVIAAPGDWPTATATHPYIAAVIAGLATDDPRADWNNWTITASYRLAAAARLGLVTRIDLAAGQRAIVARLAAASPARSSSEPPTREAARCWRAALEHTSRQTERQVQASARGVREADNTSPPLGPVARTSGDSAPPAAVVDPAPAVEPDAVEQFWQRPAHAQLRDFARARRVSPWAMLGVVLARVVTTVPEYVVLPALVGSHASLNLFVGLVGASGGGKGAAEGAAADAVDPGAVFTASVGSGEGLGHVYGHRVKGQMVRDRYRVLFSVPEVDGLTALGSRQGATLMPQLRQAWSGEALGFAYADAAKRITLGRHDYRLTMVVGIQPGKAAPLLDDADGGTPQRFLWLPTVDPDAPDVVPAEPERRKLPAQAWPPASKGPHVLVVPAAAAVAVDASRLARLRGEGDALDGHALLARLKVAAALTLLDGRRVVTDDDWRHAGTVMAVSDRTRAGVVQHLAERASVANLARGQAEGVRAAVASDAAVAHAVRRVGPLLVRHLRRHGEQTPAQLRRRIAQRDRATFDDALDHLLAAGQVVALGDDHGGRLRASDEAS